MGALKLLGALGVLTTAGLTATAASADPITLCNIGGPSGNVQMAYKASGSPVFGSDGLTCRKYPERPAIQAAKDTGKAAATASASPAATDKDAPPLASR
jgi:hypothetical protein